MIESGKSHHMSDQTYPMGARITFSANALDAKRHKEFGADEPIIGNGMVNGEPIDTAEDGVVTHIPVYVLDTDKCLMVAVRNILSVETK